ncbi:major facilitator superfamily domain-containing protein [Pochonia chlamydosporia 170]|uniref:Major facilitator superfamily domain-containing protein n=1 Tax=Pochonia chlamydosporia 170 TaxID=1380566 RepID=A0A179F078_METCM|nr:major facilitator superfamily domain-containing protein [Pochonia chlamydosporia 170]OAQ58802.2 major facilitator superfamily domain-containing protein [Pochonia chlamydosporia 170]
MTHLSGFPDSTQLDETISPEVLILCLLGTRHSKPGKLIRLMIGHIRKAAGKAAGVASAVGQDEVWPLSYTDAYLIQKSTSCSKQVGRLMEHPAEQQPLLLPSDDGELRSQDNELPERERAQQPNQALTFTFLGLILLTIGVSRCLITDATSRLERETICHQFLSSNGSSGYNNGCRDSGGNLAPEVVFELGFIHFWDNTLTLLPGILVALPFGVLADTYSRKNILTISVCGILLSQAFRHISSPPCAAFFSAETNWRRACHILCGSIFARSLVFLYLGAATVFGGILGQLLAYNLQQIDQRISTCIGLVVLGICLCLTVFVPDSTQEPSYEPASSAGDEPSNLDIAKNVARVLGSVLRQTFWDHWRLGAFLLTVLLATVFEVRHSQHPSSIEPPNQC